MNQKKYLQVAALLLEQARGKDFAGYDPFDGLNSRLFQKSGLHRFPLARLAWLQAFKRSPINFRPLALVPEQRNPKGVALFILGLLADYRRTGNRALLGEVKRLADWLLTQQCASQEWKYPCWGYHFDWQARAFYVPKGKPNVVTTWYVAKALIECSKELPDRDYVGVVIGASRFVAENLLIRKGHASYFSYIPGETTFVHNASLWGASLVTWAGQKLGDTAMIELGLTVAEHSASMQRPDGAWLYGTAAHHQFIDGFHTGYNLEALSFIASIAGTSNFRGTIAKGMAFYKENFFGDDGAAKYYHDRAYPYDMHSVAQAVLTLLHVGGTDADFALACKVVDWAIAKMYLPHKGRFLYQISNLGPNSIDYVRWTKAWSYYSLATLSLCLKEREDGIRQAP